MPETLIPTVNASKPDPAAESTAATANSPPMRVPIQNHDYLSSEWWLVYLTLGLVLVTAALALWTARLYRATVALGEEARVAGERQRDETNRAIAIAQQAANAATRTAESAERTAEKQLRAYLGIEDAILITGRVVGERLEVAVQLKNFGQTPAYKCMGAVHCVTLNSNQLLSEDVFPFDLDPEPVGIIQPGSVLHKSRISPDPITPEALDDLNTGRETIWLFGQFTYEVAFDIPPRKTRFLYSLRALPFRGIGVAFGLSEFGNEST